MHYKSLSVFFISKGCL